MRNKLLLSSLLSLSILTFSSVAEAQESADATFTGTLSSATEVVKVCDGLASINPITGNLENIISLPIFDVTTSQPTGTDGRLTTAEVSGVPALGNPEGISFIALVNGTPDATAVTNALSTEPVASSNPDVIAYRINVLPDGQPEFSFNNNGLEGVILNSPGTNRVTVSGDGISRDGTFGPEDTEGAYRANLTLTAVSSL